MSARIAFKLPANEVRRLVGMCERLASDQAGEVIAAAHLISTFLLQRNLRWADVLHAEPEAPVDPARHWSDAASELLAEFNARLTDREAKFLSDILERRIGGWGMLTDRQSSWLVTIAAKHGVAPW